jgi:hypothetical protein
MVSDVKSCAGAIFGLNPEFFVQGFAHETQAECHVLLVDPEGGYMKFAPVLFLHAEHPSPCGGGFLKSSRLVQVHLMPPLPVISIDTNDC